MASCCCRPHHANTIWRKTNFEPPHYVIFCILGKLPFLLDLVALLRSRSQKFTVRVFSITLRDEINVMMMFLILAPCNSSVDVNLSGSQRFSETLAGIEESSRPQNPK
jgi:hypothetical protein